MTSSEPPSSNVTVCDASPVAPLPSRRWHYSGVLELLTQTVLLGGPIFYVLGRIYASTYWTALGLSSSVFAVDAEDYIYAGFVVIARGVALVFPNKPPFWGTLLTVMTAIALLTLFVGFAHAARIRLAKHLAPTAELLRVVVKRNTPVLTAINSTAKIVLTLCLAAAIFLTASLAVLVPILIATFVGELQANALLQELRRGSGPYQNVTVAGKPAGRLVECPNSYCAVWTNGMFTTVRLEDVRWLDP